jgi:hypothetical protein
MSYIQNEEVIPVLIDINSKSKKFKDHFRKSTAFEKQKKMILSKLRFNSAKRKSLFKKRKVNL